MVELNTVLLIGLIGFGAGALVTIAMVLLYMAYNNINVVMDRTKDDNEDDSGGGYVMPLSAMMGGGGGGMGGITSADIQRAAAAVAASKEKAPEAAGAGNYI